MVKKSVALILLCTFCVCMNACGGKEKNISSTESMTETETSASQIETTEAASTAAKPTVNSASDPNMEIPHIFDEAGLLSAEEMGTVSQIADSLSAQYQLHAAVVLTKDLDGRKPAKFAAEYYETLYGKGSTGFLVLINNDTGEDHVFTSGACSLYLSEQDIAIAIAQATPMLVEGKYRPAMERLLELGKCMPELIYDSAGILSREQFDGFLATAQAAADETKKRYSVLLIQDVEMDEAEDALQRYADDRRGELQADGLLVVDVRAGKCGVSGFSDNAALGEELTGILQNTARLPVTAAVNAYYEKVKE